MSHAAGRPKLVLTIIFGLLLSLSTAMLNPSPLAAGPSQQGSPELVAEGAVRLEALRALGRQMHTCLPKPVRYVLVSYEPYGQNAWRPEVEIRTRGVAFRLISLKAGESVYTPFGTRMVGTPARDVPIPVLLLQPIDPAGEFSGVSLSDDFARSWDADAAATEACFSESVTATRPITPPRRITPDELRGRMNQCMPALPPPGTDEGLFGISRVEVVPPLDGPNNAHSHHLDDLGLFITVLRFTGDSSPDMGWDAWERYQESVFVCFHATSAL